MHNAEILDSSIQDRKTGKSHAPTFICVAILLVNGVEITREGSAGKSKAAEHNAANSLFKKLTSVSCAVSNDTKEDAQRTKPHENPMSALNMYCQQNQVAISIFDYQASGEAHDPSFVSTCSLEFEENVYHSKG